MRKLNLWTAACAVIVAAAVLVYAETPGSTAVSSTNTSASVGVCVDADTAAALSAADSCSTVRRRQNLCPLGLGFTNLASGTDALHVRVFEFGDTVAAVSTSNSTLSAEPGDPEKGVYTKNDKKPFCAFSHITDAASGTSFDWRGTPREHVR